MPEAVAVASRDLSRAEAFAAKNGVLDSLFDGLGIGLGFTLAVALLATIREITGSGSWLGTKLADGLTPATIMVQAPGAFLVLGLLMGFFAWLRMRRKAA